MNRSLSMHNVLNFQSGFFPRINNIEREWKGAKPCKFTSSIKMVDKPKPKIQSQFSFKKKSPIPKSKEYVWRSSIRKIIPVYKRNIYPRNIIRPQYSTHIERKRKLLSDIIIKKNWKYPAKMAVNVNNSCEFAIEDLMTRKKRSYYNFDNNDKEYKCGVEYESGFYEKGGLIVGSTNKLNRNKSFSIKKHNIYNTLDLTKKVLNPLKMWKYKVENEKEEFDVKYVEDINKREKRLYDFTKDKNIKNIPMNEDIENNKSIKN